MGDERGECGDERRKQDESAADGAEPDASDLRFATDVLDWRRPRFLVGWGPPLSLGWVGPVRRGCSCRLPAPGQDHAVVALAESPADMRALISRETVPVLIPVRSVMSRRVRAPSWTACRTRSRLVADEGAGPAVAVLGSLTRRRGLARHPVK